MFTITVDYDNNTEDEGRSFYLILPEPMCKAWFFFMSELEKESFARDRKMVARNALAQQRKDKEAR